MSCHYQPSVSDIILVKKYLAFLPLELIDRILDEASYWPHSSLTISWRDSVPSQRRNASGDKMYMRTMPLAIYGTDVDITLPAVPLEDSDEGVDRVWEYMLGHEGGGARAWLSPRGEHPARKIVFDLWSKDQGWSNEIANRGTYNGSWTWFDADIETLKSDPFRDSKSAVSWPEHLLFKESDAPELAGSFEFDRRQTGHPLLPPPTHLQRNVHAKNKIHHHTVTWHYRDTIAEGSPAALAAEERGQGWKSLDGNFIRSLKAGDCITLWMRARFPTRRLDITKASITVYWAA
ncbi:hypothetical protein BV22DRAFT_1033714 [Leucogyrophana mollusca]|uniref:Uncharacterized protein n=1 Tax=Leucogyrophana mollusca TaxID=85980 RepID=A0ACB8BIW3_9AGAM|nr:hypothetical protein BV22DRAFT_1033714 [Leucogyrophana mollusca]